MLRHLARLKAQPATAKPPKIMAVRYKKLTLRKHKLNGNEVRRLRPLSDDRRRVMSGLHLSKHEITRAEYIDAFDLSPDQLIAFDARCLHSSRPNFRLLNKRTWIAAVKDRKLRAKRLQSKSPALYTQGVWLFGLLGQRFVKSRVRTGSVRVRSV